MEEIKLIQSVLDMAVKSGLIGDLKSANEVARCWNSICADLEIYRESQNQNPKGGK